MNTKNNQRTRLSKILLKNALMDLLGEKGSVAKISVRELCERAELNRSTFYAHYSEPKELLEEVENELLDATQDHLKKIGAENDLGAHRYLLSFLMYIKENDERKQYIMTKIGSAGLNLVVGGLMLGALFSCFINMTVFVTLLCTLLATSLIKGALKLYYFRSV